MATSEFKCPKCGTRFRVDNQFLGRVAACPKKDCRQKMRLSGPTDAPSEIEIPVPQDSLQELPAQNSAGSKEAKTAPPMPSSENEELAASLKPTSGQGSSVSRPPGSRVSRVERLAKLNKKERRGKQAAPQVTGIHPAVYGILLGTILGVGGLFAWWNFAPPADTARPERKPKNDNRADSEIIVEGMSDQAVVVPRTRNAVIPVKLPSKTAAVLAAERLSREKVEKDQRRARELKDQVIPFLKTHCLDCHGPDSQEGGITVHKLASADQFLTERKMWERVYRMVKSGAMPPGDYEPLPKSEDRERVSAILYDELYNFDCELVDNPGRSTVQRLNRVEYNNTIQDIFGIQITPADKFPADDVGDGFDNIGDVLSLPPLLMEKYLAAAEEITDVVIDSRDYSKPTRMTVLAEQLTDSRGSHEHSDNFRILASLGELSHVFAVSAGGEYDIHVMAMADQGGDEKARFALRLGESKLDEFEVAEHREPQEFIRRQMLEAGQQKIGVAFLNDWYDGKKKKRNDRNLGVASITLIGPFVAPGGPLPIRHERHNSIVTAVPGGVVRVLDAASSVLRPILNSAFRRDATKAEVFRYASLVRKAVDEMGESYEGGIAMSIQAILVSPEFLFRLERDPNDGETERSLDDFEIASRLSYFLWSTLPDQELFQVARAGRLSNPAMLRQQVQRMLKHKKAEALVQNFAAQWLNLRNIDDVSPNTDIFKSFNNDLKRDMRRETELLFRTVMQEDRSVEDLLSADFTFVNKRLAKHYGINGVKSDEFERVSLNGTKRAGVLTHASILTLTSNPGRTSPVKRGKWIMENIFGEAPPPPPPDVPGLEETAAVSPDLSLRDQLAKHREDPSCAACHKVMDPLGLGLENFNAIGQWRDKDEGQEIDASGKLPSGETFDGPLQLIQIVRRRREKFLRTLTEKMLTYAIGRGAEYYDKCTVDRCVKQLGQNGQRFSVLVECIVTSEPFLKRTGAAGKYAIQSPR